MKNIIKFILSFICYIVFIPCVLASTLGLTWYVLPQFRATYLGMYLGNLVGVNSIMLITIILCCATILFMILGKVFTVIKKSKCLNFYTHLVTWLTSFLLALEAGYVFIASEAIQTVAINLDLGRKIGILSCVVGMLLYAILAPKFRVLINRRIQAYDTAKELNANGRSSVVFMQMLKCFDFIFPEIFLLIALCFAFNWEISLYFIYIIVSFILPIIGNIICDKRVKKEAIRVETEKQEAQVHATAEAVADILKQNGGNS